MELVIDIIISQFAMGPQTEFYNFLFSKKAHLITQTNYLKRKQFKVTKEKII
jgi:hypothetical protein